MNLATRIFGLLLLTFTLVMPPATPVYAQEAWVGKGYGDSMDAAFQSGVDSRAGASDFFDSILMRISCSILPVQGADMCGTGKQYTSILHNSAVAKIDSGIAFLYQNPPANTIAFIMDSGQTLGFIPKQSYAQGVGFSGLSGLLPIWKVFRNVAYLILALVMVVIGFMVMFRKKIDPKTVVTVQNALPRIVIALLLITFSYAIVGILIDLMYVLILVAVGIFKITGLLPEPGGLTGMIYSSSEALYSQGGLLPNIWSTHIDIPKIFGYNPVTQLGLSADLLLGAGVFAPVLGPFVPFLVGAGLTTLFIPVIIYIIVALALFFLLLKLGVFFLTTYIQILVSLIFAPIQLLFEAIPGSNSFDGWIKNLVSNLIVFPVAAIMFMLSAVFTSMADKPNVSLWTPPFTGAFGSNNSQSIAALLAIGVLFAIPSVAGQVKELFKSKPFLSAGPEAIAGPLGEAGGSAFQLFQFYHSLQQTAAMKKIAKLSPQGPDHET